MLLTILDSSIFRSLLFWYVYALAHKYFNYRYPFSTDGLVVDGSGTESLNIPNKN